MRRYLGVVLTGLAFCAILFILLSDTAQIKRLPSQEQESETLQEAGSRILDETGKMSASEDSFWWLNSGGQLYFSDGFLKTITGELPEDSRWRLAYARSAPEDTDNGYHPQNIFRLVARNKRQDFQQEGYFKIMADNLSDSSNRKESNGFLLFNRYLDADNLYYTGVRVDGYATIKKKVNGTYYTMAYEPLIATATSTPYDRETNPNLLPKNTWIGLRSMVKTSPDGTVDIKLYVDNGRTGNWILAAEAVDDGKSYGGAAITQSGFTGIRTDFMDVEFVDYSVVNL